MRIIAIGIAAAMAVAAWSVPVGADGSEHNRAGAVTSAAATGLGSSFAELFGVPAAQAQAVDDFGAADCGNPPRQNP